MSIYEVEADNKSLLGSTKINCSLCNNFTGFVSPNPGGLIYYFVSHSISCRIGYGCNQLCSCQQPILQSKYSEISFNQDHSESKTWRCRTCNHIITIVTEQRCNCSNGSFSYPPSIVYNDQFKIESFKCSTCDHILKIIKSKKPRSFYYWIIPKAKSSSTR